MGSGLTIRINVPNQWICIEVYRYCVGIKCSRYKCGYNSVKGNFISILQNQGYKFSITQEKSIELFNLLPILPKTYIYFESNKIKIKKHFLCNNQK